MNIPPESLLTDPATPPAALPPPVSIPSLDEGDAPAPSALPQASREAARSAAQQLRWKGQPLRWTFGRMALWQSLASASGAGTADNVRALLDASIFLFLATHDESAWESPSGGSPPLICDHQRFLTAIRRWADSALEPSLEVGREITELFNRALNLHASTRAVAVPSEEDAAAAADTVDP